MAHAAPIKAQAGDQQTIRLPPPHMSGGRPLLDTLHSRKSTREFAARRLSIDLLSDLLWAANGYNRPETKHRTAPTAHDRQELDVYVALETGLYLYDAAANQLQLSKAGRFARGNRRTGLRPRPRRSTSSMSPISRACRMPQIAPK